MSDPFKRPGDTLKSLFFGVIALVIVVNVLGAAVEPYLPLIGMTVAGVVIVLVLGIGIVATIAVIRYLSGRFGGRGTFNG
ncbi:hypothetical protein [Mycolicibacterium sp. S3B2]|uniref:hypothetical protein n=1 Tax=Mycolicibacterium sp. S3B2 TaxID=3415120 RepID=UPI003C7D2231